MTSPDRGAPTWLPRDRLIPPFSTRAHALDLRAVGVPGHGPCSWADGTREQGALTQIGDVHAQSWLPAPDALV